LAFQALPLNCGKSILFHHVVHHGMLHHHVMAHHPAHPVMVHHMTFLVHHHVVFHHRGTGRCDKGAAANCKRKNCGEYLD
jgi:hypothetical protein